MKNSLPALIAEKEKELAGLKALNAKIGTGPCNYSEEGADEKLKEYEAILNILEPIFN
jgi:hypothetical protein